MPARIPESQPGRSAGSRWAILLLLLVLGAIGWAIASRGKHGLAGDAGDTPSEQRMRGFRESMLNDDDDTPGHDPARAKKAASAARVTYVESAPSSAQGSVEGEVRSSGNGKPIAGAELTLEQAGVLVSLTTGADGHYRFEPTRSGTWKLTTISADGFLPFAPAWGENAVTLQVVPHKRMRGATLFLEPAIDYLGLVLSAQGKPVPAAEVRLFSSATDAALMPLEDVFHSDAQGEFHFRAPRDGVLEARHPRHGRGRARLDFAAEVSERVVITLDEAASAHASKLDITGHVFDTQGVPVQGAVVSTEQAALEGHDVALPVFTTSDEEGFFRLTPLDPGRYGVVASHGELAPDSVEDVAAGTHDVRLELPAGGRVSGTVRSNEGAPVASFAVHVWQKLGPLATRLVRSVSVLDPEGRFALKGLPTGSMLLGVEAPGFAPSQDLPFAIDEKSGSESTLSVLLERGHMVQGLVQDLSTKKPIAGARVTLEGRGNTETEPTQNTVQTDAQGKFAIEGVHAGQASLMVAAAEHHARILGGLPVPATAPVIVERRSTEAEEKPKLELAGLGIVLSPKDDALVVGDMAPNGGGAEAGLQVGDGIVGVAGTPVTELGFAGAIAQLRGPENTSILLSVRRKAGGELVDILVFRRLVRM